MPKKEDERAMQFDLVDEEEDLATLLDPSHVGFFQPLTTKHLNLYIGPLFSLKITNNVEEYNLQ